MVLRLGTRTRLDPLANLVTIDRPKSDFCPSSAADFATLVQKSSKLGARSHILRREWAPVR